MNIHRPLINQPRPVRFTSEMYVEAEAAINKLFQKTELRDGVIYEMPMDGEATAVWNIALARWLYQSLSEAFIIVPDKTLILGEFWAPTPDFYIYPESLRHNQVRGRDILLIVEVSDSTLAYDLGEKAQAYAAHGVREYWVADVNAKCLHVHSLQAADTYGAPRVIAFDQSVTASLIPQLTLRLSDLPRIS